MNVRLVFRDLLEVFVLPGGPGRGKPVYGGGLGDASEKVLGGLNSRFLSTSTLDRGEMKTSIGDLGTVRDYSVGVGVRSKNRGTPSAV